MKNNKFLILGILMFLMSFHTVFSNTIYAAPAHIVCDQNGGEFNTATCTSSGTKGYYCSVCGAKSRSSPADALGHSYAGATKYDYIDETCVYEGSYKQDCVRCGHTKTTSIPPLGHDYGWVTTITGTCVTKSREEFICSQCNEVSNTKSNGLNSANHEGPEEVNQYLSYATCYSKGKKEYLCKACSKISRTEEYGPVSHWYDSYETTTAATCTTNGVKTSYCEYGCGTKSTKTITKLGHDWSDWKYDTVNHWKECKRDNCSATDSMGAHVDSEPNGYCDTCSAPLYLPPTPAPTITVKDTAGNLVNTTWTNKNLVVYVSGSEIVSGTLGAVGYKYNKNNAAYSVYPSSGVSHTTLNTDTIFYAKAYNTGMETQESAVTTKVLPKIERTKPTFTLKVDNNNWAKSHTATITFADEGGSGLKADTYTITYIWTDSPTAPSSYGSNIKSVTVTDGATSHVETLTKNDGTGLYYLHIKIDKKLTDRATNVCDTMELSIPFYMDNTAPVITHKPVETTPVALNSNATYTMTMLVTDKHAGIDTGVFTSSDITVKVNGKVSTASKQLTYKSVSSGVYEYTLKLTNITETGPISLEIPANAVPDIAGNNSVATTFNLTTKSGVNFVGPYADNVDPVIIMTGPVTSVKVDTGKNLSGVIDERYINKYYTIQVPFKILDVGGQDFTNVFESEDISNVSAGNITLNPSKKIVTLDKATTTADSQTNLTIYQKDYTVTLYGLLEDGYINLTVAASSLTDLAGNVNVQGKFAPYTNQTGSDVNIYIDNTLPQPTVRTALTAQVANGATTINVDMFLKELGAGIRADQFEEADMKYRIDGALTSNLTATLNPDPGNDYNSVLGSSVPTNYTYELILSNIRESGMLRIQVTENQIIDKANNGNTSVTMDVNIEIDNVGPKLGVLVTNADANGEVYGEPIQVSIIGCSDTSGIAKYEWQRSLDGVNFETIYTENSAAPDSTVEDPQTTENTYYYRVIVTDVLGNSSTSEVVSVDYRHGLNTKPIITLTKEQKSSELVDIHGVIKSKAPIVKIVINGSEYPRSKWENNVTTNNYEITTTFDYPVTRNGIYTVEVTDEKGNKATATINIIDFDFSESIINYTKQDVTPLTPAQIIFTANEPVRIINPNAHPGITYDTTDFSTKIIAIVSPDVDFDESKIFDFENKGLTEVSVEVLPPLITRFTYLRFAGPVSTNFDMNILQISALVEKLSDTKMITSTGTIKSYYGLKNANAQIATESDINVAQRLGSAVEAYVMNDKGELVKLEKTLDSTVSSNANYSTGNVSGVYKKTSGLLDNYSDTLLNDTTIKYARFRIVLIP